MIRKVFALLLALTMALSLAVVPASANEDERLQPEAATASDAPGAAAAPEEDTQEGTLLGRLLSSLKKEQPLEKEEAAALEEGEGNSLYNNTMTVSIRANTANVVLDEKDEAYVTFTVSLRTDGPVIQAVSFKLNPSTTTNMVLASQTKGGPSGNPSFYYACNSALSEGDEPIYNLIDYTPSGRYFAMAGYDTGNGNGVAATETDVMTVMVKFTAVGTYTLSAESIIAGNGKAVDSVTQKFGKTPVEAATVNVVKSHNLVPDTVTKVATPSESGVLLKKCSHDGCDATETSTFTYDSSAVKLTVDTDHAYTGSNVSAIFSGKAKIHRGTIYVPVKVETAKTLTAASFTVSYDETRLKLASASDGWTCSGNTVTTTGAVPSSATMMTLEFTVVEDGNRFVNPGDAAISITSATIKDSSGVLTVGQTSGLVVISKAGDVNGDGKANDQDALLIRKKAAKMSVQLIVGAGDVNLDNNTNDQDALLIRKKAAKMDVVLK